MSHKCTSLEFNADILFKGEKIFTYIPSHCTHDVLCNVQFPRCCVMAKKILICQFASDIAFVNLIPKLYATFFRSVVAKILSILWVKQRLDGCVLYCEVPSPDALSPAAI